MINFTVVVTTYNRPKELLRALNSIANVEYPNNNIEVIVVDDCSTNFVEHTIQGITIKYIYKEKNRGPGDSRNIGLDSATKEFVVMLDDDDELLSDSLSYISSSISRYTDFPVYQFLRGHNSTYSEREIDFKNYLNLNKNEEYLPVFNKKEWLKNRLYYPINKTGGESLLWLRILSTRNIMYFHRNVAKLNSDAKIRLTDKSKKENSILEYQKHYSTVLSEFDRKIFKISILKYLTFLIKLSYYSTKSSFKEIVNLKNKHKLSIYIISRILKLAKYFNLI